MSKAEKGPSTMIPADAAVFARRRRFAFLRLLPTKAEQ